MPIEQRTMRLSTYPFIFIPQGGRGQAVVTVATAFSPWPKAMRIGMGMPIPCSSALCTSGLRSVNAED